MNKRFFPLSSLFLGLAFCLVSCGGGATNNGSSSANSSTASNTVKLSFWHTSGAGLAASYAKAATTFSDLVKKNEGVDVNITISYQGGYSDIERKISNGFATGDVPTLAIAYPDHV